MADIAAGFPFLKLPLELRNMVYKELLIMPGTLEIIKSWSSDHVVFLVNRIQNVCASIETANQSAVFVVFLVSKQIRREAISIYFGCNKFGAMDTDMLAQLLYHIGPEACNAIREISIEYDLGKHACKAFKLLAQCGGLRKLHFHMLSCPLSEPYPPDFGQFLLKKPGIQSLLKIRGIQELDVVVSCRRGISDSCEGSDRSKESFTKALQILMEPPDFRKQRRIAPKELWYKAPMMTRARASRKEQSGE